MTRAKIPGRKALGGGLLGAKALGGVRARALGLLGRKALGGVLDEKTLGGVRAKALGMLGGMRGVLTGREDGRVEGTAGAGAGCRGVRRGEGDLPGEPDQHDTPTLPLDTPTRRRGSAREGRRGGRQAG